VRAAADEAVGLGGQTAPAIALIAMSPRMNIKLLAERLKLSHPAAVRIVHGLVKDGMVQRVMSDDKRAVHLVLTRKGAAAHERMRKARQDVLDDVLDRLSPGQKSALQPVLFELMQALTCNAPDAWTNCRLCDAKTCAARGCPVAAWEQPA
jgi:MarR family transcriptional regulator, negative regulator of the multidrug operon emrRAB